MPLNFKGLRIFCQTAVVKISISIYEGDESFDRTRIKVIVWFVLLGILLVFSYLVGEWRAQTTEVMLQSNTSIDAPPVNTINYGRWVLVLLTMLTPIAFALLYHQMFHHQENTRSADQDKIENRHKYDDLRREARKSERRIRRMKRRTAEEVRQLQMDEHENQMAVREKVEWERRQNRRFVQDLKSTLEKLRFEYLKAARKMAPHLLSAPSRDSGEA